MLTRDLARGQLAGSFACCRQPCADVSGLRSLASSRLCSPVHGWAVGSGACGFDVFVSALRQFLLLLTVSVREYYADLSFLSGGSAVEALLSCPGGSEILPWR